MFSLMWSEHCSYKHSRPLLRRLPHHRRRACCRGRARTPAWSTSGDGWAVALKVESHNHPSAVEPFEGAATGVGGIVRDILAMGARPIALLDSLRFGELSSARSRHLFTRAVAGIGHYGNCIGVPTVGGEVAFDDRYEESCLVNAMCVGRACGHDGMLRAAASGPGNALVLIGNRTGRDGIGGASVLASAELDEDEDKRPSVQVSDPFTERKLMDCCLELAGARAVRGPAGPRRRRPHQRRQRDGRQGARRPATSTSTGCRCASAWRRPRSWSPRARSACWPWSSPARLDEVVAVVPRAGTSTPTRHRHGDRGREPGGPLRRRGGGRPAGPAAGRRGAGVRGAAHARRRAPAPLDLREPCPSRPTSAAAWLALLGPAQRRQQALDLRALRPPGRRQHDPPARRRRRRGAPARASERAIALTTDCAERHCEVDPRDGGRALGARGRAQPGLRRGAADRRDRLPQLRQPGEGLDGLAAGARPSPGWRTRCRALGVPVVSGQRVPLQ